MENIMTLFVSISFLWSTLNMDFEGLIHLESDRMFENPYRKLSLVPHVEACLNFKDQLFPTRRDDQMAPSGLKASQIF